MNRMDSTTQEKLANEHYVAMALPVEEQEIIDAISALVLTGEVDFYAAKHAIEDGDWDLAKELISG